MVRDTVKYLDKNGLATLWSKIKSRFVSVDTYNTGMSGKQNALGISSSGSASKFLNQQGQFVVGPVGPKGDQGAQGVQGIQGVGISKIEQTTISTADGGSNVITVTLTNNTTSTFTVKNGTKGNQGYPGERGEKGDPLTYDSLTDTQKTDLANHLAIQSITDTEIASITDA